MFLKLWEHSGSIRNVPEAAETSPKPLEYFKSPQNALDCILMLFFLVAVLITRLTTQRWLDIGANWTQDEHRTPHSLMRYEFRVVCDAHYYGSGCTNLCRPRDDNFGHYTCSPTGSRLCLPGWHGDYCTNGKWRRLASKIIFITF